MVVTLRPKRNLFAASARRRLKKAAIPTGVSLAGHAVLFWLLALPHRSEPRAPTEVTLTAPAGSPGAAGAAGSPATEGSPRSHSHATRGHRLRPLALMQAARAESAESQPVADVPPAQEDQSADGDDTPGDDAPGDGHDGDGVGRKVAHGAGSGGNAQGGDGDGRGADLSQMPELDRGSCTRGLAYPWRAALHDKEGVVRMRVSLDAAGRVHHATVLQKAGYGFDEAATEAVMRRCRFTAALDHDGKPTAFVIDDYRFYFRFADFEQLR